VRGCELVGGWLREILSIFYLSILGELEISHNVRDIRSFSGTKWKKNLGEGRAEPRTVYPLLYAPTTERRRAQRGTERSGVSSKNIFRS